MSWKFAFILLVMGIVLSFGCSEVKQVSAQVGDVIRAVTVAQNVVPRYGKFEASVHLSKQYANPFDPNEVWLQGHFISPSQKEIVVDGFYFRDFERRLEGNSERLTPKGNPEWRVRFTPTECGEWKFWVTVKDKSGEAKSGVQTFRCATPSPSPPSQGGEQKGSPPSEGGVRGGQHGFVRISKKNPLYFEFDDGQPYFAVGENVCWSGSKGTYDYDNWFSKLSAHGGNYARLWIGPFDSFTLERKKRDAQDEAGIGRYDLANAWRLDYVLQLAEQKGIYLMFCIESFNSLRIRPEYAMWHDCPYNAANGGPLQKPEEFFTNAEAKRFFRNRLRYLIARYGYSPHVLSWEFWNEVDIIEKYESENVRRWHQEMARFIRRIDPYRHLITTSYAGSEGDVNVDGLPEMDYVQTHNYGSRDVAQTLSDYCLRKAQKYGKPHYVGEFGVDWQGKGNAADPTGVHLHNGLWAPIFSLSAGTGMLWWWDNYVDPMNLYHHFAPVAKFVKDVKWTEHQWKPLQTEVAFVTPPQRVEPEDLMIEPSHASWQPAPFNQPNTFTVHRDGRVEPADRLSRVLHGVVNHKDKHNPATFHVDFPQPGKFVVRVQGVSGYGGGHLNIWVDGQKVLDVDFPDTNPPGKHETLNQYNGAYAVQVSAGKHVIKVENVGRDWIFVSYELTGYKIDPAPNLRVLGIGDDSAALLWIQNKDNTWYRRSLGKEPREVAPTRLTFTGLRDGSYTVEWWDTDRGVITATQPVRVVNGKITLNVLAVKTDVACKVRREHVGT